MLDAIQKKLLSLVADITETPKGAYNIRSDSESAGRQSTENIQIISKEDKPGIDIIVKPGTKGETVHIPAVITHSGVDDLVYNDFIIGEDADVTIVAGCGIHTEGTAVSHHTGVHKFIMGKNSRAKYLEKHIGVGEGTGERVIDPTTVVEMEEGSVLEIETTHIEGIDSTKRVTEAKIGDNATLLIKEKMMTHDKQYAETRFDVDLCGDNSKAHVVSRSVAKGDSKQVFYAKIDGNNNCYGHSECDAILMDNGQVSAVPEVNANHLDATLIHEAVMGKIAGEQLTKLMTLGLSEKEAEERIIEGFLA
jgi:ABC-type transport system involved in Fe-S cluster assembly, permease component